MLIRILIFRSHPARSQPWMLNEKGNIKWWLHSTNCGGGCGSKAEQKVKENRRNELLRAVYDLSIQAVHATSFLIVIVVSLRRKTIECEGENDFTLGNIIIIIWIISHLAAISLFSFSFCYVCFWVWGSLQFSAGRKSSRSIDFPRLSGFKENQD